MNGEYKADYKNWIPKGMIAAMGAGAVTLAAGAFASGALGRGALSRAFSAICGLGAAVLCVGTVWSVAACRAFSYEGTRKLSKRIVEGVAEYVALPDGGRGLDVGCGSGALTIACAKRNPRGQMVGIDRWGLEYASFSKALCERNAAAEGVENAAFERGDAVRLDYPDESFDAVISNYVYHNIPSRDRQKLLLETLRVLKKGGAFAIHDIMTPSRYGDMEAFAESLRKKGYESVELIDTSHGLFMSLGEAKWLGLNGSALLTGRK